MEFDVLLGNRSIASLHHDPQASAQFALGYAADWSADPAGFDLAPSLPLRRATTLDTKAAARLVDQATAPDVNELAHAVAVRNFFENLLPEGRQLEDAARALQISRANVLGVLRGLNGDFAGALRVLPPGQATPAPATRRRIPAEEIASRILERPALPFSVWDGRIRLSIPGFQDKLCVLEEDGQFFLVDGIDGTLASTRILKPEPQDQRLAGLTSNEFFCLRLSAACGLRAASASLLQLPSDAGPQPVLNVSRFDRAVTGKSIERIYTFDGCQGLGLPSAYKFERPYGTTGDAASQRTGASLPPIFALLSAAASPVQERTALLRWVIFQVLIKNCDAHAKNLSFFANARGLSLTPAYDLVSLHAVNMRGIEDSWAMGIGDAFTLNELSAFEWAQFAQRCGLPKAFVARQIRWTCDAALTQADAVADACQREGADPAIIQSIVAGIKSIGPALQKMAKLLPKIIVD